MLDGIGKHIGLSLTILLSILLRAEDYGLTSMQPVNPVNDLVEPLHFLELFGIDVEEVLLNRRIGTDSHDYYTGLLILITFTKDLLQHLISRLDDSDAGAGRRNETLLQEIPVLWQVFTESICIQEYANDGGHRILHPQLFSTAGSIVRDMGSQRFYVPYHAIERTAGTYTFLLRQFLIRHHILTVQFLPRADDIDVIERQPYPILMVLRKVIGSMYAEGFEFSSIAPADAPDIINRI